MPHRRVPAKAGAMPSPAWNSRRRNVPERPAKTAEHASFPVSAMATGSFSYPQSRR